MNIDVTPLLTGFLTVLASLCIAFVTIKLAPEVKRVLQSFKASYPAEAEILNEWIATGIDGAEERFEHREGAAKLEWVLVYVEKQAARYGLHFDEYVINVMIHAKLHELETAIKDSVQ